MNLNIFTNGEHHNITLNDVIIYDVIPKRLQSILHFQTFNFRGTGVNEISFMSIRNFGLPNVDFNKNHKCSAILFQPG